jgi:hypothetical protein
MCRNVFGVWPDCKQSRMYVLRVWKNNIAGVRFGQPEIYVLSVLHIHKLRKLTSMSWKLGTYRNVCLDRLTQLQAFANLCSERLNPESSSWEFCPNSNLCLESFAPTRTMQNSNVLKCWHVQGCLRSLTQLQTITNLCLESLKKQYSWCEFCSNWNLRVECVAHTRTTPNSHPCLGSLAHTGMYDLRVLHNSK